MSNNNVLNDMRFVGVARDPKFKKLLRQERKVTIDKRFQSMFKNDAFRVKYTVDKRGRQVSKSTSEDFKRFYDLPTDEESASSTSEDEKSDREQTIEVTKSPDDSDTDTPILAEDDLIKKKQIARGVRKKLKDMNVDYARGEGELFSESSSDESESEESETENVYHEWNELDKDAENTQNISNRLAVCNMDWDRIRAVDLMVLFKSFLPLKGLVRSVAIYPSEFGLKRMAEEELRGPTELINDAHSDISDSDSDQECEEGKRYHMERMRQYQLNRLKYYYAVATFDTPETADHIYTNCNGIEYESSGIRLDLRFIDDSTTFEEEPKDICDSSESCQKYKPRFFTNTALQQAKVDLTWDETDPRRLEFTQKITESAKIDDIRDSDLEDFVALSSSGEEENEKSGEAFEDFANEDNSDNESDISDGKMDPIMKYRNLLKEIEQNEKEEKGSDEELEITWGADSGKPSEKTKITKNTSHSEEDEENSSQGSSHMSKGKLKVKRTKVQKQNEDSSESEEMVNDENENGCYETKKLKSDGENSETEEDEEANVNSYDPKHRKPSKKSKNSVLSEEDEETPFQRLVRKRKEKSKMRRKEKMQKQNEELSENEKMTNDKQVTKKKTKKKSERQISESEDELEVDVNDDRFSSLYSSHLFNIDPTNPNFRKSKGMNAFVLEKQKRLHEKVTKPTDESDEPNIKKRKDSELSCLVKSLKSKMTSMLPKKSNKPR